MAIVAAFTPIVFSVLPQVSNQLLAAFGWRGIFWGYGIVILAAGVILYFFLEEPATTFVPAAPPDPRTAEGAPAAALTPMEAPGMTAAEALRSRPLWVMIASGVAAGILGGGWMQHSFAFQLSRGFSQQVAVNALTVSMLITPAAVLFGGWLVDKVQTAKVFIPFALMSALSAYLQIILWANHGGMPLLFASVTLSAMALNVMMPMMGYFYTRFFGMKAYGEIFGINMAVLSLVMGFSAPLVGMLFERTGSYDLALYGMIVGAVLSGLFYLGIGRYRYTTDFKVIAEPAKE